KNSKKTSIKRSEGHKLFSFAHFQSIEMKAKQKRKRRRRENKKLDQMFA
ncbi:hypothetical protein DERF_016067, partial [Dermatophagoides farinae]